jgi:hypothetical protein
MPNLLSQRPEPISRDLGGSEGAREAKVILVR